MDPAPSWNQAGSSEPRSASSPVGSPSRHADQVAGAVKRAGENWPWSASIGGSQEEAVHPRAPGGRPPPFAESIIPRPARFVPTINATRNLDILFQGQAFPTLSLASSSSVARGPGHQVPQARPRVDSRDSNISVGQGIWVTDWRPCVAPDALALARLADGFPDRGGGRASGPSPRFFDRHMGCVLNDTYPVILP